MALPNYLPLPPVVTQEPAQCWAAAYECWSLANQRHLGLPAMPAQGQVIDWLSGGAGFLTSAGRATPAGVGLMGNIALMYMERMRSSQVTADLLGRKLDDGYVYCAFYWNTPRGGRRGHAVVIYGVDSTIVAYSDPAPGQGLIKAPVTFFSNSSVNVVLGTSLLVDLRRGIDVASRRLGAIQ